MYNNVLMKHIYIFIHLSWYSNTANKLQTQHCERKKGKKELD